MRRTPLKAAAKPLARTALRPGRPLAASRKPISQRSARRIAEGPARALVRLAVAARDKGRCRLADLDPGHRCFGPPTPHHLRKASQGGEYSVANIVTLCAEANGGWVESHPIQAHALGLVIRREAA